MGIGCQVRQGVCRARSASGQGARYSCIGTAVGCPLCFSPPFQLAVPYGKEEVEDDDYGMPFFVVSSAARWRSRSSNDWRPISCT